MSFQHHIVQIIVLYFNFFSSNNFTIHSWYSYPFCSNNFFLYCRTLPPNFFMEWCYNYISTGEMDPEVITERDVSELMELIKEVGYLNVVKVHCESYFYVV